MSVVRRLALGFPLTWSHRRGYSLAAAREPGSAKYFIEWDPGSGIYGEDFTRSARDERGVIVGAGAQRYHPIRIAQFALHRYGVWRDAGDVRARDDFFAQAEYLRDAQRGDGAYAFAFPWPKYGAPAGWISAMAQGEAISVLLRAEHERPGDGFALAAERAASPFSRKLEGGGVTWSDRGDIFFEEIAVVPAAHVLNGCIFALFGLWEFARVAQAPWADRLVECCGGTLRRWITLYDTGWWSLYSLVRSASGHVHVATLKYHAFHVAQLCVLAELFRDDAFDRAAARWSWYVARGDSRRRVIADSARSIPERLLRRDTLARGAHA